MTDNNLDNNPNQGGADITPETEENKKEIDAQNASNHMQQGSLSNTEPSSYMYNWDGTNQITQKKNKRLKVFAATVTICLLLTFSLIAWSVVMGYLPNPISTESDISSDISNEESGTLSVPEVVKVGEGNAEYKSDLTDVYDRAKESCLTVLTGSSMGSGFVVTEDGYIITNHHVIKDATNVRVVFYEGDEYNAEIIGSDSISDIAVLKIEGEGFVPLEIGNSDNIKIGEQVAAIGTPYSIELAGTMNMGIISGIARNIEITNDFGTVVKTMTLIQTDTSINPGNSGGPLINMAGQIVGINTLKLMNEYEGLGFAIPINNAVTIINTLIEFGEVNERPDNDFVTASPRLNITVMSIEDAVNYYKMNFSFELPSGAFVTEVARNSAIYRAGLEIYDIITEFNGVEITTKETLTSELANYRAGQSVSVKVFRINRNGDGGEYHELSFRLDTAE